jgi:hypothetical protein
MPIYLDPRVIEGSLYSLGNDTKHNSIMSTMNGLELSVLENRLKTTVEELKNLSVELNTCKCDLKHSLTQHLHPQQFGGQACECPHTYYYSSGWSRLSTVEGVECGSSFTVCCNTPLPRSPGSTGSPSSPFNTKSKSESDIMPPLEDVTSGSGGSEEEESNGSQGEEDWKSTGEEGGNMGRVTTDSEGSGDEAWELSGFSGVHV